MAEAEQPSESVTCGIKIAAKVITTLVEDILPAVNKFLQCPLFHNKTTAEIVTFQMRELKQEMKELLTQLKKGFFKSCQSISTYGTNEQLYQAIKEDISKQKLKRFLTGCDKRLNIVFQRYVEACEATATMKDKLEKRFEGYEKKQTAGRIRSLLGNIAYSVGGVGILVSVGAAVVLLSPITVPAVTVGTVGVAAGATGTTGVSSGYLLKKYDKEEDIKALKEALEGLSNFQKIVNSVRTQNELCYRTTSGAADNLRTTVFAKQCDEPQSADTKSARYVIDDEYVCDVENTSVTLDEFKKSMKKLKEQTNDAMANLNKVLAEL